MKNFKSLICTVTIGLTLITQLAGPFAVYADDDTPPAPTEAPTIVTTQLPTDSPTDAVPAETPIPEITATDSPVETPSVSDSPKVDAIATATPLPQRDPQHHSRTTVTAPTRTKAATDFLPTETTTDLVPTESLATGTSTTTADIVSTTTEPTLLETLPDNTNLVVLDQNGDPLSLATQQAADAIATADPVWCPDGVLPIPGLNGCTASYATMNDLLTGAGAYINNQNVNGTIWITFGAVGDVSPVIIQGLTYTNWANHSLTLQGGWSGTAGDPAIGSNSAFSVAIEIKNWNNNVTVNNITVSGATTNNGLNIYSDSTNIVPVASINNSNFSGNLYAGFWIEDAGSLSINNSSIGGNKGRCYKSPQCTDQQQYLQQQQFIWHHCSY